MSFLSCFLTLLSLFLCDSAVISSLSRAAVLERMPVIEKTPSGHTNGESTMALARDQQGERLLLPKVQPASQVPFGMSLLEVALSRVVLHSAPCVQVCDLLDLLGGSDEALTPSSATGHSAPGESANTTVTAGSDLLDLLGGMDPVPFNPGLNMSTLVLVPVAVVEM